MDPNANLTEQLKLSASILNLKGSDADFAWRAGRLAELVEALAAWLESGGALPDSWEQGAEWRRDRERELEANGREHMARLADRHG